MLNNKIIQRELVSLGALRKLVTPQLSADPLGGAVGAQVKSLLSWFRFKLLFRVWLKNNVQ